MRDAATEAQVRAAAPDHSTWLAANAGSGKTRVLTDRVARLLLDGTDPSHILCLTYTKAAASEMQNRLFRRLGAWAMLPESALRAELQTLGVEADLSSAFLQEARTLFARAIETPGGLRIQTIHAFCAALLRRFPLEARVSPQFQEMEDRAGERLRAEILDRIASGPDAALLAGIAPSLSGDDVDGLLAGLCARKTAFSEPPTPEAIRTVYGLAPDMTEAQLLARVFLGGEMAFLREMLPALDGSGANDRKLAAEIRRLTGPDMASLEILESCLLTGSGAKSPFAAKIGSVPTKGLLKTHPMDHILPQLDALMLRVETAREQRLALAAAEADIALYAFGARFVPLYEAEKQARGWLDFDDLITRARDLLSDPRVADWVLYRLDGGIDHILVDEAQDTAPVQWQVIERLAREFTAGEGARTDTRRTIFVVGDKKQSIYSFQGADPSEFDRMRADFRDRLANTDAPLVNAELAYSFRSADPILRLVDLTFEGAQASGFDGARHIAFNEGMPGRVDLWPVVESVSEDKDGPWHQPLDRRGARHHTAILARRIARFIKQQIDTCTPLPVATRDGWHARPVQAGDFLILVRSRNRLFQEIIRAAKQEGLPIAGADRLKVMAELAVRDVIALLRFLETPEDSLSLACALRSPLFGLSEQALFDLAHRRTRKFLWEALRDRAGDFPEVMTILEDLRGTTNFLRPYDLIDRILTRHLGRRCLIGRLGAEAEDGINALLAQALAYEQTAVPTLTGFLEWAEADNLTIKRAPDSAGDVLRVMTVHGAKGLEAPFVILPDCGKPDTKLRGALLGDETGVIWKQTADDMPARQRAAAEAARLKEAQERDRLLYVALTRAETRLIVAAAGDIGSDGASWYDKVRQGMETAEATPQTCDFGDLGSGEGLTLDFGDPHALPQIEPVPQDAPSVDLPVFLDTPIAPPLPAPASRAPSDLGGAKALPGASGDSEEIAKARGTAVHLLLETLAPLPADVRPAAGASLAAQLAEDPATAGLDHAALLTEALGVLDHPGLARFFAPGTLAEVPVTADLGAPGRIHGVIDRLIVTDRTVTAVDYKTNRTVPHAPEDTPDGLLRQMGAYARALALIYPDREIETGLIWTATAHYMPLPHDLVTQALARAATP